MRLNLLRRWLGIDELTDSHQSLLAAHGSTIARLHHLESVPTPTVDPETVATAVASHMERIDATDGQVDALAIQVEEMQGQLREYVIALEEGILRVDRSERRVKAVVRRAQGQLAVDGLVDDGVEAEAQNLRLVDDGEGNGVGVQPVPPRVAPAPLPKSGFPGLSAEQLHSLRMARHA